MARTLNAGNFKNSKSRDIATALHNKVLKAKNNGLNCITFNTTYFYRFTQKNKIDTLVEVFNWLTIKCGCMITQTDLDIYEIRW